MFLTNKTAKKIKYNRKLCYTTPPNYSTTLSTYVLHNNKSNRNYVFSCHTNKKQTNIYNYIISSMVYYVSSFIISLSSVQNVCLSDAFKIAMEKCGFMQHVPNIYFYKNSTIIFLKKKTELN